jgi:3-dehydroquinate dehydratase II
MAMNILCLHGPNLDLLGTREPHKYGTATLESVNARLSALATDAKAKLTCFQSNSESELLQRIHQARNEGVDFILINPAAYTHTSIAIRDALAAVAIPFVEIHLTNIHTREPFRQRSLVSDLALGVVSGLGAQGYELALAYALDHARRD